MSDASTTPSAGAPPARATVRRWCRRLVIAALLLAVTLIVAAPAILRGIGRWLVVGDELARADAIYVHAGHLPVRALEAADLYLEGLAREVWLAEIVPTEENAALLALGLEVPSERHWNREVLLVRGVPHEAIRVLPVAVANTRDEVLAVAEELRRTGGRRAILVTSRQHSRRVWTLWRRYDAESLDAVVRPSRHDPFDPDRWWTNTRDGQAVLHELVGIVDAWLDLGLRPERAGGSENAGFSSINRGPRPRESGTREL